MIRTDYITDILTERVRKMLCINLQQIHMFNSLLNNFLQNYLKLSFYFIIRNKFMMNMYDNTNLPDYYYSREDQLQEILFLSLSYRLLVSSKDVLILFQFICFEHCIIYICDM
jgi:hypothetical protein